MAEFAVVAPIFLLVLFGTIEFGRAIYTIEMLNNAAREGARYAIVHGANSTCPSGPPPTGINYCDPTGLRVESTVKDFAIAIPGTTTSDFVVTRKWCAYDADGVANCPGTFGDGSNGRTPANAVVVTVTYTYRPILGLLPLPSFTLSGGSTLVINN